MAKPTVRKTINFTITMKVAVDVPVDAVLAEDALRQAEQETGEQLTSELADGTAWGPLENANLIGRVRCSASFVPSTWEG